MLMKYRDYYLFLYCTGCGFANMPFIFNRYNDNSKLLLSLIWDLHFNTVIDMGETLKIKIYGVKGVDARQSLEYLKRNRKNIKPLFRFKHRVVYPDNNNYSCKEHYNFNSKFWIKRMDNGKIFVANPGIVISSDYLDSIINVL